MGTADCRPDPKPSHPGPIPPGSCLRESACHTRNRQLNISWIVRCLPNTNGGQNLPKPSCNDEILSYIVSHDWNQSNASPGITIMEVLLSGDSFFPQMDQFGQLQAPSTLPHLHGEAQVKGCPSEPMDGNISNDLSGGAWWAQRGAIDSVWDVRIIGSIHFWLAISLFPPNSEHVHAKGFLW